MYTTLTKYNTNNIEKFVNDVEKYFIGGDDWLQRFGALHESSANYPPYNLVKENSTNFRIEVALAGYKKENIEVTTEWNKLIVESKKIDDTTDEYLHHGIAKRAFTRTWTLSDDVVVGDVTFGNGLLTIKLNKIIPDHQKKKVYEILPTIHTDDL
jgi:molecular chaperone IbpA